MFANQEFIDASRKFVCIRIETYENKDAEAKVRALLNGAYANTAFCIFDPQGEKRLTRSGRGPHFGLSRNGRSMTGENDSEMIRNMKRISADYDTTGERSAVVLQDFHSFRQALNVASADQRLLVAVNAQKKQLEETTTKLQTIFSDKDIEGKFHLVFLDKKTDKNWSRSISGSKSSPGLFLIRAGRFGQDGAVMKRLELSDEVEEMKEAMLKANKKFAAMEDRKIYSQHVMAGKRQGIRFENEISPSKKANRGRGNR